MNKYHRKTDVTRSAHAHVRLHFRCTHTAPCVQYVCARAREGSAGRLEGIESQTQGEINQRSRDGRLQQDDNIRYLTVPVSWEKRWMRDTRTENMVEMWYHPTMAPYGLLIGIITPHFIADAPRIYCYWCHYLSHYVYPKATTNYGRTPR